MGARKIIDWAFMDEQRRIFLQRILDCVRDADRKKALQQGPNGFRTSVDSWFGYYHGGGFVKSTGTVQWLNRGDLAHKRHRKTVSDLEFISEAAWKVLQDDGDKTPLMKDHAVPVSVIYDELLVRRPQNLDDVEAFLLERYKLGIITDEEDRKLTAAKLRSKMPAGDPSTYARYNHPAVQIKRYIRPCETGHTRVPEFAS